MKQAILANEEKKALVETFLKMQQNPPLMESIRRKVTNKSAIAKSSIFKNNFQQNIKAHKVHYDALVK